MPNYSRKLVGVDGHGRIGIGDLFFEGCYFSWTISDTNNKMLRSHIFLNDCELLMTFRSIGIHEPHMKLNGPRKKRFRTRFSESGKSSTCTTSRVHNSIQRVRGCKIIGLIASRELVLSPPPHCEKPPSTHRTSEASTSPFPTAAA